MRIWICCSDRPPIARLDEGKIFGMSPSTLFEPSIVTQSLRLKS